jgi:uncharacterized protein YjbI with pentapeptide repeats
MSDRWITCDQEGCSGACVGGEASCLAHMGAKERRAMLEQFSESGELDVRGVTIQDALMREILDAAPQHADGHCKFSAARFDRATFEGGAVFSEATFKGLAGFGRATFEGNAVFSGATFEGLTVFSEATFEAALFSRASFKDAALFNKTRFKSAGFDEASFEGDAEFPRASFEDHAVFSGARFERLARFGRATFEGDAAFDGATFQSDAPVLGPIAVGERLDLDGAQFASAVRIETDARALTGRRGEVSRRRPV